MPDVATKPAEELALMHVSGQLLASVFAMLDDVIAPGISAMDVVTKVKRFIVDDLHSPPASRSQQDFP